jgi:RNA polymerase sigma-70 factor (ECF subfamily)
MNGNCTVADIEPSIVERAWRGDDCAFALLVEHHTPMLRALAVRMLGDRASVDDALQEAFAKAFRALPAFRGASRVSTWLYRICHNVCADELRRRRRGAACIDDADLSSVTTAGGEERALDREVLSRALDTLSPELRATVVLVCVEGFNYAAAAEVLCVPTGTIASRIARARVVLRRHLEAPACSRAA